MNNKFEIIPAIDILDGKCVRLTQGDYKIVEEFSTNPLEVAKKWEFEGAERLHLVDLNGAKDGFAVNKEIILKIVKNTNMQVEVGGGIRNVETIKEYLEGGLNYVIVGTKVFKDISFLHEILNLFGKKIILGLDMKDGKIALSGWNELIEIDFNTLIKDINKVDQVIFTDISKDGMLTGPNLDSLKKIASLLTSNIIASGGMSKIDDIISIIKLRNNHPNISGAILGKSLYKGTIDLKSALEAIKSSKK